MSNVIPMPQPPEIIAALKAAGCGILRRPKVEEPVKQPPTFDNVEFMPQRIGPPRAKQLQLKTLRSVVAVVCQIPVNELISERRYIPTVRARHIFYWVARNLTTASLPAIGRACGGRDHSTVMHGISKVEDNRATFEPELSKVLDYMKGRK